MTAILPPAVQDVTPRQTYTHTVHHTDCQTGYTSSLLQPATSIPDGYNGRLF